MKKPTRTNLVLGATAMALALTLAAKMGGANVMASAEAQPPARPPEQPSVDTPFNAAEQRKQAIIQLQEINRRLTSIEQRMSSGLSVKVTEMPEVRVKDPSRK